jgi:hypothetical protein
MKITLKKTSFFLKRLNLYGFTLSNPSTIITIGIGISAIASNKKLSSDALGRSPVFGDLKSFSSK